MSTQTYVTATEARKNFFDLIHTAKGSIPVNITVKGIPEVVMMSKEDFDGWMATIETMSDKSLMEAIKQGKKDFKNGDVYSLEEVAQELGFDVQGAIVKESKKRSKKAK